MTSKKPDNPARSMRLGELGPRVDLLAAQEGVKASTIVRRALMAYLEGDRSPAASDQQMAVLSVELTSMRRDMARVGGNLNQLAFAFNLGEESSRSHLASTHAELQAEFGRLATLLNEVRNAVKR